MLKYMQILMHKENEKQWNKVHSIMSNLQTKRHFKQISKKWTNIHEASG